MAGLWDNAGHFLDCKLSQWLVFFARIIRSSTLFYTPNLKTPAHFKVDVWGEEAARQFRTKPPEDSQRDWLHVANDAHLAGAAFIVNINTENSL